MYFVLKNFWADNQPPQLATNMRLRDKTRRRIARTVLAVFGWAPIVLLIIAAFFIHSQTYIEWSESALTNALEMQVNFESFECPRWDTSRFGRVTLSDPETGVPILKCAQLEVEHQHTKTPIPLLRIRLRDCKVYMDNSTSLWYFVQRSFAHRRLWKNMQVEFSAANIRFDNCNSQTIRFMSGSLNDITDGAEGIFAIYFEDKLNKDSNLSESNEPVRLKITRMKNTSPATTTIAIDASKHPLSTEIISHWHAPIKRLGSHSHFCGTILATNSGYGWDGTVTGNFDNVDLSQIFVKAGKSQCSAVASITISHGEFIDQRLVAAQGSVNAQNGMIDRSLMDSLITHLHLSGAGMFNNYYNVTPFKQLAFNYKLQNEMIAISGTCNSCPPGVILNGAFPLIREPLNPENKAPVSMAMKLFSPGNSQQYIQIAQPDTTTSR